MADEAEVIEESTEVIEESTEVEKAPVKRGRGRPKGTTKSGLPYVPKPKSGLGRGRPKGSVSKPKAKTAPKSTNGSRSRPKKDWKYHFYIHNAKTNSEINTLIT